MKVLLDECLPLKVKNDLPGHTVATVPEMGWKGTKDTPLLRLAEGAALTHLSIATPITMCCSLIRTADSRRDM